MYCITTTTTTTGLIYASILHVFAYDDWYRHPRRDTSTNDQREQARAEHITNSRKQIYRSDFNKHRGLNGTRSLPRDGAETPQDNTRRRP
jgi:hypothetical protein